MLKHRFMDSKTVVSSTNPQTPLTVEDNVVVLSEALWRANDAFDRLIGQHLAQYHHVAIEKLAPSIVRHWIGNYGGRFLETSPTRGERLVSDEPCIAVKIGALIKNAMNIPTPGQPCCETQSFMTPGIVSQSPDHTASSISPFNHSLGPILDEETKSRPNDILLPMIPADIFDLPMPEMSPQKSPRPCKNRAPRVFLNMKPLESNSAIVESLQPGGIEQITSPMKNDGGRDDNELATPKVDNTTETKNQTSGMIQGPTETTKQTSGIPLGSTEVNKQTPAITQGPAKSKKQASVTTEGPTKNKNQTSDTTEGSTEIKKAVESDSTKLPHGKRFKKNVSFDEGTKPPSCSPQEKESSQIDQTKIFFSVSSFTSNDIVFSGAWARKHKGNMLLNEWMTRFCKNINERFNVVKMATQIVSLFKRLSSRFLEGKTSLLQGQTIWVEVDDSIVTDRMCALIKRIVNAKNPGIFDANDSPCCSSNESQKKAHILKIDIETFQIRPGKAFVLLDSTAPDHLSTDDVLLGQNSGRDIHFGNLKFFHHLDDHVPKYERTTSVGGKLNVIRHVISAWKKQAANKARFLVRNGDNYSLVSVDDELTVFLGIVDMIDDMIRPIPQGSPEIYLGENWTIQRNHQRNGEFYRMFIFKMTALVGMNEISTNQQRIVDELSIAGDIVRSVCWESYPSGPFKGGFNVFDTTKKDWVTVTVEEAVKMTVVLLRLKLYFSSGHRKSQDHKTSKRCGPTELSSKSTSELSISIESNSKKANKRSGSTQQVQSPKKAAAPQAPTERSTHLVSLLQSDIWSPNASPEKHHNRLSFQKMAPTSPIPCPSFVQEMPSARMHAIPIAHPMARHFTPETNLDRRANAHPHHIWAPVRTETKFIPESPLRNDRFLPALFNGRFTSQQHPSNSAFWPTHHGVNDLLRRQAVLQNQGHLRNSLLAPCPSQQLVWLPFTLPVDAGATGTN